MNFFLRAIIYGTIILMPLISFGSRAETKQVRQLNAVVPTLFESNKFNNSNRSNLLYQPLKQSFSGLISTQGERKNVITTNVDWTKANTSRSNLEQINYQKIRRISLRDILLLEIVVVTLIIAYTYCKQQGQ